MPRLAGAIYATVMAVVALAAGCGRGARGGGSGSVGVVADAGGAGNSDAGLADAGGAASSDAGLADVDGGLNSTDAGGGISGSGDGGIGIGIDMDAGTDMDAGASVDGGTTASSDCDGLLPADPAAPAQFKLVNQDLVSGTCLPAETDGTGHLALLWQDNFQPHDSQFTFVDPLSNSAAGTFTGTNLRLIGQNGGFMGGDCAGADCTQDYVVLDAVGNLLYRSPTEGQSNNLQVNDPTGGMIHVRASHDPTGLTLLLDKIDIFGAVLWTHLLPYRFGPFDSNQALQLGVDRQGNVLALWNLHGTSRWSGQWLDPKGVAGPVFPAFDGQTPAQLFPRVDSGLFLLGVPFWLGQFEPLATAMTPPPAWLAARPNVTLQMVHGGLGYAALPAPGPAPLCQSTAEILSPSGATCGSRSFIVDAAACTTTPLTIGYDGTVTQQLPAEREAPCTAAGHQCDCTYRYWPGYFR
jgi:hypothetical protein